MHMKNKFISIILAVMVAVAWTVPAFADDVTPDADSGTNTEATVEETKPAKQEKPAETVQTTEAPSTESTSEKAETPEASGEKSSSAQNEDSDSEFKANALTGGHSVYHAVDNTTTLGDGTYGKDSGITYTPISTNDTYTSSSSGKIPLSGGETVSGATLCQVPEYVPMLI